VKKVAKLSKLSKVNRGTDLSIITASLPDPKRPKEIFQRAYQSLINQDSDYKWEWRIQVDGGEKELKIVKSLLGQAIDDPRVKLYMNTRHLGQAITRNLALRAARGGAVVFLDDDDELTENAFRTWLKPLEKKSELGLVGWAAFRW
jgi:glycosyltransferase involved in cell wall biosynthesis